MAARARCARLGLVWSYEPVAKREASVSEGGEGGERGRGWGSMQGSEDVG